MKRLFLSLAIILFVSMTMSVSAQRGEKGDRKRVDFTKELNLSSEQQTQVESINKDFKSKHQELKAQTDLSKEDKRSKMNELKTQHHAAIKQVLTPEQQQQIKNVKGRKGDGKKVKKGAQHRGDRMKDVSLTEDQKQKIEALKQNFEKEKRAVEMSRIAPAMQKQKIENLRKSFKKQKKQIIDEARKADIK